MKDRLLKLIKARLKEYQANSDRMGGRFNFLNQEDDDFYDQTTQLSSLLKVMKLSFGLLGQSMASTGLTPARLSVNSIGLIRVNSGC